MNVSKEVSRNPIKLRGWSDQSLGHLMKIAIDGQINQGTGVQYNLTERPLVHSRLFF